MEVLTQKTSFLHVFCDVFICWKLLPYFVVFGVDFHYCFNQIFAMIIFLSVKCFSVYFSMELFIGYLKTFH